MLFVNGALGTILVREKILFLFDNLELSGADRVALDVARILSGQGSEVALAVCMDVKEGFSDLPVNLTRLSPASSGTESLARRIWRGMVALVRCMRLASPTSIMVSVTPPAALVGAVAAWWSGGRSIPWVHYDLAGVLREPLQARGLIRGLIQRFFYRHLVPLHSHLIFVSEAARKSMATIARRGTIPAGWVILPNVVSARERKGRPDESTSFARIVRLKKEGKLVFMFIARIARQKRWGDVLAAAELTAAKGLCCNWVIIGDGPERADLESALKETPCRNVEYLGPDPNPLPALALADVLVLTSLYEAWPTVILEAFQLGIPVIAYDCPSGPREMIGAEQERGYLVAETPEAISARAVELMSAPDACRAKVDHARNYARRFEPDAVVAAWQHYLESLRPRAQERRIDR